MLAGVGAEWVRILNVGMRCQSERDGSAVEVQVMERSETAYRNGRSQKTAKL